MSAAELFAGAGSRPGVEAWRIEKMKPVKQPPGFELGGKFHVGDSYIVLHTFELKGAVAYNAHFWIGDESTRDEAGAAALLTVELDQFLGDVPTQFRETQARESREFLQLFPNGVRYLEGGVDSAFVHVDRDAYEPRLLHVKGGRKNVRVVNVPMSVASLNSGDAFILDTGKTLTQWNGAGASRAEKAKALDVVLQIKSEEHGGKSTVLALEELGGADQDGAQDIFAALAAGRRVRADAPAGGGAARPRVVPDAVVLIERLPTSRTRRTRGRSDDRRAHRPDLPREALKPEERVRVGGGRVVYAYEVGSGVADQKAPIDGIRRRLRGGRRPRRERPRRQRAGPSSSRTFGEIRASSRSCRWTCWIDAARDAPVARRRGQDAQTDVAAGRSGPRHDRRHRRPAVQRRGGVRLVEGKLDVFRRTRRASCRRRRRALEEFGARDGTRRRAADAKHVEVMCAQRDRGRRVVRYREAREIDRRRRRAAESARCWRTMGKLP